MIALYRLKDHIAENEPFISYEDGHPVPDIFLKVWQGDLGTHDFREIYASLGLNPPRELHGCGICDTDILEVDGKCYIFQPPGFTEVEFDTEKVKVALNERYGDGIALDNSAPFTKDLADAAYEMDIPVGHESPSGVFRPGLHYQHETFYLHPDYAKGDEAKRLVSRLGELIEFRDEVLHELLDCRPVYPADIDRVWKQFADKRAEQHAHRHREQSAMADMLGELSQDGCAAVAALLIENGVTTEEIETCTATQNQSQQM